MKIPINIERMFERCQADYKRAHSFKNYSSSYWIWKDGKMHKVEYSNKMSKKKASKYKGYVL